MYGLVNGKKAFVTGAATGIGYAVAKHYAENGADVILCDLDEEKVSKAAESIRQETGKNCIGLFCDVSDKSSVIDAFNAAENHLGRIDIVCNSAGILIHSEMATMEEKDWDRIFAVNMKGAFLVAQQAARIMKKQRSGKIVFISSCSGKKPTMHEAAYCATKSGINGFMKVCALELGAYGVNVNAVLPGATDTDMTRTNFITSPEIEREWIEKTALKRLGTPDDQAKAVLFLSSDLADHITGESLIVSAGECMTQ